MSASWIKNAIVYEIYPQSFCDSNGDGIGDLPGIISKLDYIRSLNVNAIWLNACFLSPFRDGGYDVSDFYRIAPRYGDNADFELLAKEAHKRGIKVILDLVAGHTSTEHPYFLDSARANPGKYKNYYIWTEGWPCDWVGALNNYHFISGVYPRDGFVMTNYFTCQPSLNYGFCPPDPAFPWQLGPEHPDVQAVRQELKNVMKFWIDLGCDGFRVDCAATLVRGANKEQGIRDLWLEYRAWLDAEYPEAALIAEWVDPQKSIAAGFDVDFMIQNYDRPGYSKLFRAEPERIGNTGFFDKSFFDRAGEGDASIFLCEFTENLHAVSGKGWIGLVTGNHDIGRIAHGRTREEMKGLYSFLLLLPGVPFLYYGDEIGMDNVYGLGNKEGSYNRSAVRTPMQWEAGEKAGFSTAKLQDFYLPLDPSPSRPDVAAQEKDPESLLAFVRWLFALRQNDPAAGNDAEFTVRYGEKNCSPVVYERTSGNSRLLVAVNPFGKAVSAKFPLPQANAFSLLKGSAGIQLQKDGETALLRMPESSFAVFRAN